MVEKDFSLVFQQVIYVVSYYFDLYDACDSNENEKDGKEKSRESDRFFIYHTLSFHVFPALVAVLETPFYQVLWVPAFVSRSVLGRLELLAFVPAFQALPNPPDLREPAFVWLVLEILPAPWVLGVVSQSLWNPGASTYFFFPTL